MGRRGACLGLDGTSEWKRVLLLIAVLAVVVLVVGFTSIRFLYTTAVNQERDRLRETVQSQARVMESLVRHESSAHPELPDQQAHVLNVFGDAYEQYQASAESSELVLARREGDRIVFLLRHGDIGTEVPESLQFSSDLAEPMRRALQGRSGTIVGLDYRGVTVVAAFEPVAELGLGIVAKINLKEIRAPFVRAALYSLGPALAAILVGAWAFTRITRPIVLRIGQTERRYRDLVETMAEGLWIQDEARTVVYVNDRLCEILGRPRGELVGRSTSSLLSAEDRAEFDRQMDRCERGEAVSRQISFVRPDGSRVDTLVSPRPVFDRPGRYAGSFAVVSDVTALKRVAEQLRRERERAQQLLDVAGVMFVVLSREGTIQLINRLALEVLGYGHAEELLGRDWFSTCVPENERNVVRGVFVRLMEGEIQPVERFENRVVTRSGETRIVVWRNTVLTDDEGEIIGTLSSGEDVTARRQAEEEKLAMEIHLRQSQKLESIGTLASGVAHELSNPLTGIINYAQLIHDRVGDASMKEFATEIVEEGNRMAKIVRHLLSFARRETERRSPADLCDIIDETLSLIGAVLRKDQIRVEVDAAPDLPKIWCRSQQVQQVLMNLLTNARDALNARYPEYDEDKVVRITAGLAEDGTWVRTTVEDHGSGIPEGTIERIFDPFFTTKPRDRGTGLGLSISYGIVRDHGGRLMAESEPDTYTRLVMDLPVEPRRSSAEVEESADDMDERG